MKFCSHIICSSVALAKAPSNYFVRKLGWIGSASIPNIRTYVCIYIHVRMPVDNYEYIMYNDVCIQICTHQSIYNHLQRFQNGWDNFCIMLPKPRWKHFMPSLGAALKPGGPRPGDFVHFNRHICFSNEWYPYLQS